MEGQEYRIRDMILLDEDRKKKIKIGSEEFVIKAPFPKDKKEIARRLAFEYNGAPLHSISMDDRYLFERDVTLDVLIEEHPKWYEGAEKCIDDDLKEQLYQEIAKWSEEFQEKLKKNKFSKRGVQEQVSN